MKKAFLLAIVSTILLWASACGGGDSFRITGEITGKGTQNLNVVYFGDGSYHTTRTAAIDGKFMFDGSSRSWTTVYFFNNSRALIGMVIIKNGENVEARFGQDNISLSGTKPSELLGQWMNANAEALAKADAKALNQSISDFIGRHSDNIAATVILTNYFDTAADPALADSLFQLIDPKARPSYMAEGWMELNGFAADSTRHALPDTLRLIDKDNNLVPILTKRETLLLYSPDPKGRNRASDNLLKERLKKARMDSLGLRFLEVEREIPDTATWHRNIYDENLPWQRLWHPFNASVLPWSQGEAFLLADSTGTIVYNGADINIALDKSGL